MLIIGSGLSSNAAAKPKHLERWDGNCPGIFDTLVPRDIAQAGCSEETIKARVATGSLSASVRYVLCLGCFGMLNFEKVDGAAETALLQSSPFAALLG